MLTRPSFVDLVAAIESDLRTRGVAFERREQWAWCRSMKPLVEDDPSPARWGREFAESRSMGNGRVVLIGVR
jgi:hypothetical protein